ncbi:anti-sigma factor [Pontivivens ytuae]|uniref:Anti-sigma factor n=1 Tax=Pontivivens ytuae TaxID=2789856 RepID=A0A7S9LSI7_9RHOB|nr:anti-sigma factor [Pontivivens ytuae]QPH54341.1 anti-sigma factor [Pontivivens ytuae]
MSERTEEQPPEEGYLAAELALDLLEGEARAAALARASYDPDFAAQVAGWRQRLTQLDYEFAEVSPPPAIKSALEEYLFEEREEDVSLLARLWRGAALWRGIAVAGVLAAVFFAVRPVLLPPPAEPPLVTALYSVDGSLGVLGLYDREAAVLRLNRVAGAASPGRELELWFAPDAEAAPRSLGLITDAARVDVPLPADLAQSVGPAGYFAISDEPPGGSPTGAPTGAILAIGPIAPI